MRRTYELGRRDEQTKLAGQTRSASERNIRAGETRWGSERNIRAGQTGWGEARENAFLRRSHVLVVYLQSAGGRRSQHGLHGRVRGVLHGRVRRRLAVSSHHRRIMSCPVARDAGRAPVGRHDGVGSRPHRTTINDHKTTKNILMRLLRRHGRHGGRVHGLMRLTKRVPKSKMVKAPCLNVKSFRLGKRENVGECGRGEAAYGRQFRACRPTAVGRHDGIGSRQPMRLTKRVPK